MSPKVSLHFTIPTLSPVNDDSSTCELCRIVGLYYNEENDEYNIKIVRNDSIGKYQFYTEEPENVIWTDSTLYKKLTREKDEKNMK